MRTHLRISSRIRSQIFFSSFSLWLNWINGRVLLQQVTWKMYLQQYCKLFKLIQKPNSESLRVKYCAMHHTAWFLTGKSVSFKIVRSSRKCIFVGFISKRSTYLMEDGGGNWTHLREHIATRSQIQNNCERSLLSTTNLIGWLTSAVPSERWKRQKLEIFFVWPELAA